MPGRVLHVDIIQNDSNSRSTVFVVAVYDFGGSVLKEKRLNICSLCKDDDPMRDVWICHTKSHRSCYAGHMDKVHGM